ncbi:hypothetical protein KXW41_005187, partial [Aspergillus fumigatus]
TAFNAMMSSAVYRSSFLGFRSRRRPPVFENSSWAKVNPHFETPFNAQLCVGIITALLGCIYLGSSTAFNAMMSSAV